MTSFPSCQISVYIAGTLSLATLYSDPSGTPLSNPFTATTTGYFSFFADDGFYDLALSQGGITSPFTWGRISLFDWSSPSTGTHFHCPVVSLGCISGRVQFSDGTDLNSDSGLTWNNSTKTLSATNFSASGNGTFGGTFGVTGATTLGSTLGVSGAGTFSSSLTVLGNILTSGAITNYEGVAPGNLKVLIGNGTKFTARVLAAGDLPAGTTPAFQVNATPTTSQTTINFQSGTGVTVTNPSAGNVSFSSMGGKLLAHPTPTTSAPTTTSATPAVLAEMTAAITVDSGISGVLLLFNAVVRETNVNDSTAFQFFKDGVAIGPITYMSSAIGSQNMGASLTFVDVATAGAHTYDVRWNNSAGGNTSTSDLLNRSFEVLELN